MKHSASIAMVLVTMALAGCGSADADVSGSDMWARPTAPDAANAAFYGTITNETDGVVVVESGYSPSCERVELHRSTMSDGVMSMEPALQAEATLGAGEALVLEPMGLHIMCIGLTEPLSEGSPVSLELSFDGARLFETDIAVEQR